MLGARDRNVAYCVKYMFSCCPPSVYTVHAECERQECGLLCEENTLMLSSLCTAVHGDARDRNVARCMNCTRSCCPTPVCTMYVAHGECERPVCSLLYELHTFILTHRLLSPPGTGGTSRPATTPSGPAWPTATATPLGSRTAPPREQRVASPAPTSSSFTTASARSASSEGPATPPAKGPPRDLPPASAHWVSRAHTTRRPPPWPRWRVTTAASAAALAEIWRAATGASRASRRRRGILKWSLTAAAWCLLGRGRKSRAAPTPATAATLTARTPRWALLRKTWWCTGKDPDPDLAPTPTPRGKPAPSRRVPPLRTSRANPRATRRAATGVRAARRTADSSNPPRTGGTPPAKATSLTAASGPPRRRRRASRALPLSTGLPKTRTPRLRRITPPRLLRSGKSTCVPATTPGETPTPLPSRTHLGSSCLRWGVTRTNPSTHPRTAPEVPTRTWRTCACATVMKGRTTLHMKRWMTTGLWKCDLGHVCLSVSVSCSGFLGFRRAYGHYAFKWVCGTTD